MTHEDLRAAAEAAFEEVNRRRSACATATTALDVADADYDRDPSDWAWLRLAQARAVDDRARRDLERAERLSAEARDAVAAAAKADLERALTQKVEEASSRRLVDNLQPTIARLLALDAERSELWEVAADALERHRVASVDARRLAEVLGIDAQDVSVKRFDEDDVHDLIGVALDLDRTANGRATSGDDCADTMTGFRKPGWNDALLERWEWAHSTLIGHQTTQQENDDHGTADTDDERREGGTGSTSGDDGREGQDDEVEESDPEPMADDAPRRSESPDDIRDSAE